MIHMDGRDSQAGRAALRASPVRQKVANWCALLSFGLASCTTADLPPRSAAEKQLSENSAHIRAGIPQEMLKARVETAISAHAAVWTNYFSPKNPPTLQQKNAAKSALRAAVPGVEFLFIERLDLKKPENPEQYKEVVERARHAGHIRLSDSGSNIADIKFNYKESPSDSTPEFTVCFRLLAPSISALAQNR